jgi:hypothetical protein
VIRKNNSQESGGGIGLYAQGAGSNVVAVLTNNIIAGNNAMADGAGIFAYGDGSAMLTLTVTNDTITDNTSAGHGGGLSASSNAAGIVDVSIINSILWGNAAAIGHDIAVAQLSGSHTIVRADYSDIGDIAAEPGAAGDYYDLGHNMDLDPKFVNFIGEDYHLAPDSLLIDHATATGAPSDDIESQPRPQGTGYDIGATERFSGPLSVSLLSLPPGDVGLAYRTVLGVSGGQPPYLITVTPTLLNGLAVVGESLSGVPTTAGKKKLTIKVSDGTGASVTRKYTLTINKPLAIGSSTLTTGKVGRRYNSTIKVSGGTKPYQWSWISEPIPGVSLNSSTGQITGTPSKAGSYNVTVQVSDSIGGSAQKMLTLKVN